MRVRHRRRASRIGDLGPTITGIYRVDRFVGALEVDGPLVALDPGELQDVSVRPDGLEDRQGLLHGPSAGPAARVAQLDQHLEAGPGGERGPAMADELLDDLDGVDEAVDGGARVRAHLRSPPHRRH